MNNCTLNEQLVILTANAGDLQNCTSTFVKYIDRLGRYQTLVKRKIKRDQVNELLRHDIIDQNFRKKMPPLSRTASTKLFGSLSYIRHRDKTNCYNLAKNGNIHFTYHGTELRIFALIRLGVKEFRRLPDCYFILPKPFIIIGLPLRTGLFAERLSRMMCSSYVSPMPNHHINNYIV